MAAITDSTQTGLTALQAVVQGGGTNAASGTTADETQDRFLKVLMAQMKNQDPMNPMDNAQVTSQLAQISTVQGIEKLNTTMSKFADSASKARAADAVGLIGQSALVAGTSVRLQDGQTTPVRAGFELAAAADTVKLELLDASGNVVDARELTKVGAGTRTVEWTGKDPQGRAIAAGSYTMRATALAGGAAVGVTPLVSSQVLGVTQSGTGTQVLLANGSATTTDDIKGLFRP